MVFLDANVPMYLIGADHPNKRMAVVRLEQLASTGTRLVTDAEVYQEILHRYRAIGRPDAIQSAFEALDSIVDEVFPIARDDVEAAKTLLLAYPSLSARDALHAAVMKAREVATILSF